MEKQKLVLIGASTGGPGHLKTLLRGIPSHSKVPIVIAQHMGTLFIPSFVQQFNNELNVPVRKIDKEYSLNEGGVYICETNSVVSKTLPLKILQETIPTKTVHNPNVDVLFHSAVYISKQVEILAILLTGIGADGASGIAALHKAGAICVAENEESAIVYGMPKRAKEMTPDLQMLSLEQIRIKLEGFVNAVF